MNNKKIATTEVRNSIQSMFDGPAEQQKQTNNGHFLFASSFMLAPYTDRSADRKLEMLKDGTE